MLKVQKSLHSPFTWKRLFVLLCSILMISRNAVRSQWIYTSWALSLRAYRTHFAVNNHRQHITTTECNRPRMWLRLPALLFTSPSLLFKMPSDLRRQSELHSPIFVHVFIIAMRFLHFYIQIIALEITFLLRLHAITNFEVSILVWFEANGIHSVITS